MSTATLPARAVPAVRSGERVHRFILIGGYVIAVCFLLALAIYGWDYYTLDIAQRPFSDKHSLLKPSGVIGLKLGFLGLGAQPPTAEWGTMLADSREFIRSDPWIVTLPGLAILITVVAINLAGDGLRDALDPKMRRG